MHAEHPSPLGPTPFVGRHRARWPGLLALALLMLLILLAIGGLALWAVLAQASAEGVSIVINGHRWGESPPGEILAAGAGLGLAGLAVMAAVLLCVGLVVPLILGLVLLLAGLALSAALVAVGLALALGLSPLWLPLLLLWLWLRPARPALASSPA